MWTVRSGGATDGVSGRVLQGPEGAAGLYAELAALEMGGALYWRCRSGGEEVPMLGGALMLV